jgi:hypothetical protein
VQDRSRSGQGWTCLELLTTWIIWWVIVGKYISAASFASLPVLQRIIDYVDHVQLCLCSISPRFVSTPSPVLVFHPHWNLSGNRYEILWVSSSSRPYHAEIQDYLCHVGETNPTITGAEGEVYWWALAVKSRSGSRGRFLRPLGCPRHPLLATITRRQVQWNMQKGPDWPLLLFYGINPLCTLYFSSSNHYVITLLHLIICCFMGRCTIRCLKNCCLA